MTKKKKTALDHILTFVVLAGLSTTVALGLNEIDSTRLATQATASTSLSEVSANEIKENKDLEVNYDYSEILPVTADNIRAALDGVNVRDLPIIGGIAIPSIELNLPIIKGVSDAGMFTGASTLSPTQELGVGNYALASHRSIYEGVLFGSLPKVAVGDMIYMSDLESVFAYEIIYNEVFEATAMHVLDETDKPSVTLITCTIDGTQRVIVRAELSEEWTIEDAPVEVLESLSAESQSGYENSIQ